jgi:hypothetical protein
MPPRPRRRAWVWFFAVLAALAAAAVATPLVYNLRQQLTPEKIAAARALWRARGPRDYDLEYREKIDGGGETEENTYRVQVRGGRVTAAVRNGELVLLAEPARAAVGPWPSPAQSSSGCEVEGLFDRMEAALRDDAGAGRRPFTVATFDAGDGHPVHYVRYWKRGRERLEWNVVLRRTAQGERGA